MRATVGPNKSSEEIFGKILLSGGRCSRFAGSGRGSRIAGRRLVVNGVLLVLSAEEVEDVVRSRREGAQGEGYHIDVGPRHGEEGGGEDEEEDENEETNVGVEESSEGGDLLSSAKGIRAGWGG